MPGGDISNDVAARKTTEAQLIDRAMKDAAFRAELESVAGGWSENTVCGTCTPDVCDI